MRKFMLYVCEVKFKRTDIGMEIIDSLKDKIKRFSVPRGYAIVPVLFYLGDLSDAVYESEYFFKTIDIADLIGL